MDIVILYLAFALDLLWAAIFDVNTTFLVIIEYSIYIAESEPRSVWTVDEKKNHSCFFTVEGEFKQTRFWLNYVF